jgi:oligoendopeptidase F
MHPSRDAALWLLGLSLASVPAAFSVDRDRAKIPDKYKWNLTDIFPGLEEWKSAKAQLMGALPSLEAYRGHLADSPARLADCLETVDRLAQQYARLSIYAQLNSDIDTRNAGALSLTQEMGLVGADFSAKASFIEPEILVAGRATVDKFVAAEPRLAVFRHNLDDILRRAAHTGNPGEEKIISDAGLMADGASNIFNIFSNADFPFPTVTFADGSTARLDKAAFNLHRASPNREDRKKVFATYLGALRQYQRTFGTQLYSDVKKNMFYMKARKYGSCVESALDGSGIPVQVYRSLIDNVHASLPAFHRYLGLRKRLLGVDQLHYYDLYAPAVAEVEKEYTFEEARDVVLASIAPLGEAYRAVARKAFADRWFDVYPNDGKVAGAYSNGGIYDTHPFMLLNYNGKYNDVSTLTHELGHTMHSALANAAQPHPTASYSVFVAEVASTFNEALLMDHMMKTVKEDSVRLSLLVNYLDGIRATLFRQTQFAEFELRMHEMAERGETLTGENLTALYTEITRAYYGHDAGVCVVDDEIQSEWMNVPHFYYNFYVYQYATSLTASSALSEEVLAGDRAATERYLTLLKSGGSDYPMALLKKAGVDMATSQPFQLLVRKMNRAMDEVEKILVRREKKK